MTDPAAARSGAAPQQKEIADLIRKLRLDASGEHGRISADDLYRAAEVLAALAAARLALQQENEQLQTERDEWIARFNKLPEIVSRAEERGRLRGDLAADPDSDESNRARRVLNLVTDNPAVIAVMGSRPECAANGCQLEVERRTSQQRLDEICAENRKTFDAGITALRRADAAEAAVTALQQQLEEKIAECGQWKEAAYKKIRTWEAIQGRHRAGDSVEDLAHDYGVPLAWLRFILFPENDLQARYARGSDRAKTARADLAAAEAARTALRQELERHLRQKIDLGMRVGQILGPDYDGESFERIATELAQLRQDLWALRRYQMHAAHGGNVDAVSLTFPSMQVDGEEGEWIRARDLADRLAREEQAAD